MIRMSTARKRGRPSKGPGRTPARTLLPQQVRADVDVLVSSSSPLGEVVAVLAETGLQHVAEAEFAPSPADAVPTWTRLPRPLRAKVDELVLSTQRSIGEVVAALVAVGLRHIDGAALPAKNGQEALMTA